MCGIYGGHPSQLDPHCGKLLHHRGPDQAGEVTIPLADGSPFLLGQTRLNVVDRHDIHPIPFARDEATILFNGEIYNWRQLRGELEAKGWQCQTATDTEIALLAYLEWGEACLHRFNGMFALAIWHGETLFLARDRMGKKPLFYSHTREGFAFASEIKCFSTLEFRELELCTMLEFYFDEHTPFAGILSLLPGESLTYHPATDAAEKKRWWRFPRQQPELDDPDAAVREFLDIFTDACALRRAADVPVTLFLSGGIDSSLIQAVLKLDVTYTCQFKEFEKSINERALVQEFAQQAGFEARMLSPGREAFFSHFPAMARYIEFPIGSFTLFPLYCLARQARQDGFKVALSGEGADELFNGYYRNELLLAEDAGIREALQGDYRELCRRYFGSPLERFCRMASRRGLADVHPLVEALAPWWREELGFAHNISFVESTLFLQPLLTMADRMSMANALETRNPFLDYRIVEFAARLDPGLKVRDGHGKWVLRQALRTLVGPDLGIVRRTVKHGLPSPVNLWLFKKNAFDRQDWNRLLLGECLKQLSRGFEETK